jgi:hypothetical protein
MSRDLNSLSSFTSEEKKLKDDDKLKGSSLFLATQEKPTLRFFSWLQRMTISRKARRLLFDFFVFS